VLYHLEKVKETVNKGAEKGVDLDKIEERLMNRNRNRFGRMKSNYNNAHDSVVDNLTFMAVLLFSLESLAIMISVYGKRQSTVIKEYCQNQVINVP
jgi:hypothetical protein